MYIQTLALRARPTGVMNFGPPWIFGANGEKSVQFFVVQVAVAIEIVSVEEMRKKLDAQMRQFGGATSRNR